MDQLISLEILRNILVMTRVIVKMLEYFFFNIYIYGIVVVRSLFSFDLSNACFCELCSCLMLVVINTKVRNKIHVNVLNSSYKIQNTKYKIIKVSLTKRVWTIYHLIMQKDCILMNFFLHYGGHIQSASVSHNF